MGKSVIIIGAGGHAKVIADIILNSGDKVVGFLDDKLKKNEYVLGLPILGKIDNLSEYNEHFVVIGIGSNYIRKKISEKFPDIKYYTAIHPTATIGLNVTIGEGTVIMGNAVINTSSNVGRHCIINTGSLIEHDNTLEDYVHISPNATLGGTVFVGALTHIGLGASVRNNIFITGNCVIGVGSVVVDSIKEKGIYMGIPAKKFKEI